MNKHKQLLSFSPKNNTTATDFNLLGDLLEKISVWPIIYILGHMKDSPVLINLKVKVSSVECTQREPLLSSLLNCKFTNLSLYLTMCFSRLEAKSYSSWYIDPKFHSHPQLHSRNFTQSLTLRVIL